MSFSMLISYVLQNIQTIITFQLSRKKVQRRWQDHIHVGPILSSLVSYVFIWTMERLGSKIEFDLSDMF